MVKGNFDYLTGGRFDPYWRVAAKRQGAFSPPVVASMAKSQGAFLTLLL